MVNCMVPRSGRAAARLVSLLCGVGVLVTVVFAPFQPDEQELGTTALAVGVLAVLGLIVLAVATRLLLRSNRWGWTIGPLLSVAAILVLDLATRDATVSGQIFLVFPVLYGASQLPVAGSVIMTGASVVAEVVVVTALLPTDEALVDMGYVVTALVTISGVLTASTHRQAQLLRRLEQMAAVDPLTGLVTRRVLDEAATSALSGAASVDGTSLMLLDVDEFKSINDDHGHPAGDAVLIELAHLIGEWTRPVDVVCRLGGDEIAVLMPACPPGAARQRAGELLEAVCSHAFGVEDGEPLRVTISIGLAHAPNDAQDVTSLYGAADAALYQAKRGGRRQVFQAGSPAVVDSSPGARQ